MTIAKVANYLATDDERVRFAKHFILSFFRSYLLTQFGRFSYTRTYCNFAKKAISIYEFISIIFIPTPIIKSFEADTLFLSLIIFSYLQFI